MFYQIQDYKGVDTGAPTSSIMVGRGDYNLVVHDFGRGASLDPDAGIGVKDITDSLKSGIGVAQLALTQFVGAPVRQWSTPQLLHKAMDVLHDDRKRLLAITSKVAGDYKLKVAGNQINVAVRKYKRVGLCFVYYQYIGDEHQAEWQALGAPSSSDAHATGAVVGLNYYFLPQANIEFSFQGATDWETTDYHPTWYMRDGRFNDQKFAELAHSKGDDITVIIVPEIGDIDAGAFTDGPKNVPGLKGHVSWVPWHFQSNRRKEWADPNADPFIPELAHEIVHALCKNNNVHSSRAFVVCNDHTNSKLDQEYLIDKVTLDKINPV